jgi:hypothetical protein
MQISFQLLSSMGWTLSLRLEHYRLLKPYHASVTGDATGMCLIIRTRRPTASTRNDISLVTAVVIRDHIPTVKNIRTSLIVNKAADM